MQQRIVGQFPVGAQPDTLDGWLRTATHLVPAGKTCLTEALTAQCLLRRRGADAALRIGVARATDAGAPLTAHAWLEQAGRIIMGGETADGYEPLPLARRHQ